MEVLVALVVLLLGAGLLFRHLLKKADAYTPPLDAEVPVDEDPLLLADPLPPQVIETDKVAVLQPEAPAQEVATVADPAPKPKRTRKPRAKKTSTEQ